MGLFFFLPAGLLLLLFSAVVLPNSVDKLKDPSTASIVASLPAIISCFLGIFAVGKALRSIFPKSNKVVVDTEIKLATVVRAVAMLNTWAPRIFFPRSLIIQSSDVLWRESVKRCGEKSGFAVIDLSRTSESLDWELNYLRHEKEGKFVIMIREGIELPRAVAQVNAPIFRYRADPGRSRAFSTALRNWLETL